MVKLSGSICGVEKADCRDWGYPEQSRLIGADMSSGTGTPTQEGRIQVVSILQSSSVSLEIAIIKHELCTVNCS